MSPNLPRPRVPLRAPWPVPDDVAASADLAAYERHFAQLSERYGYPIPIPMRSIVRVGNQLLREQQFDNGISVFEQAMRIYDQLPEAHWRVGEAYRLAGRLEEARPHFERGEIQALLAGSGDGLRG